jgi:hypothetical protein
VGQVSVQAEDSNFVVPLAALAATAMDTILPVSQQPLALPQDADLHATIAFFKKEVYKILPPMVAPRQPLHRRAKSKLPNIPKANELPLKVISGYQTSRLKRRMS